MQGFQELLLSQQEPKQHETDNVFPPMAAS